MIRKETTRIMSANLMNLKWNGLGDIEPNTTVSGLTLKALLFLFSPTSLINISVTFPSG